MVYYYDKIDNYNLIRLVLIAILILDTDSLLINNVVKLTILRRKFIEQD